MIVPSSLSDAASSVRMVSREGPGEAVELGEDHVRWRSPDNRFVVRIQHVARHLDDHVGVLDRFGFILLMTSEAISKKSPAITPYSVLCR